MYSIEDEVILDAWIASDYSIPADGFAISYILARKEFTQEMKKSIALYIGCVAGASQVSNYEAFLKNAGFNGKPNRPIRV